MPSGKQDGASLLDGVGRVIALNRIICAIAQKIYRLRPMRVDNSQPFSSLDKARPRCTGRNDFAMDDGTAP